MLFIYSIIPIISLALYYNKYGRDNVIRFKQLINKIKSVKTNDDFFHTYEKNNRKVLWSEGIHIILTYFPFIGYGL